MGPAAVPWTQKLAPAEHYGSAPAPGYPDVPLDSRRGSDDDVGARDDALPDDVASGRLRSTVGRRQRG